MADSSKDSEDEKKERSPAPSSMPMGAHRPNVFREFLDFWWPDVGKSGVNRAVTISAVRELVRVAWPDPSKKVIPASAMRTLRSPKWPELRKSVGRDELPVGIMQDLLSVALRDAMTSKGKDVALTSAFDESDKPLAHSQKLYEHIVDHLMPSTWVDTLGDPEVNLSPVQADLVQTLSEQYLLDRVPDVETFANDLQSVVVEELHKLFHNTEESWSDPVHTKFIETAAGAGRWLEEKYPDLQEKTNRVLSDLITRFLYQFIPALNLYLGTIYGLPGLMAASAMSASFGLITDKKKRAIDRAILLDRPCSYCDAKPGEQCVTKGGKNPGTKTGIHKARWQ